MRCLLGRGFLLCFNTINNTSTAAAVLRTTTGTIIPARTEGNTLNTFYSNPTFVISLIHICVVVVAWFANYKLLNFPLPILWVS